MTFQTLTALDVHYDEACSRARAAAVVFSAWGDAEASGEHTAEVENVQPYVPGEFYRRELPCLMAVLAKIGRTPDVIVVDGYVRLGDKPGLGQHLFEGLGRRVAVVGVAKTRFHGAPAVEVLRGGSTSPLYVSAVGMELEDAVDGIKRMHGPHRMPTILKRVDRLARG
jgi:deoxyribonuclease V